MNLPLEASEKKDPFKGAASFSLGHRLTRILWSFTWALLASWTPAPLHRWRVFLLKIFGAQVHSTAHVYGSVKIWYPANLIMDAHACLAPHVNCYNMNLIHIGEKAIVSQYSTLCGGTHDISDPKFQLITKPIIIEKGAWVAANAFIGPGVTIAENSVVGACGVVFKNTVKNGVYTGNPAQFVKMREFNDAQ
ncbi:putative colanic acid biosynthesis acetyltransferase [Acinetobacter cumulans]|uniref:Colanic acid biosynthesis acetyltransferase n=1 Tax=Acinetobacter cumulans TaxID=2136182 RepID=A0ABX9U785_9GAMM|nr:putative colanic acid biosynthesis acetyltransferase [Acinetobacter cumulans]RLL47433.1 putative colanic acid biosynthesis acetyltransferase [Acinetobacter cumulans]